MKTLRQLVHPDTALQGIIPLEAFENDLLSMRYPGDMVSNALDFAWQPALSLAGTSNEIIFPSIKQSLVLRAVVN